MQSRQAVKTLSRMLLTTLTCWSLLAAGTASAEGPPPYSQPGLYVALGGGWGHWIRGGPDTGAISGRFGWREPEVAFELQVDYLPEADTRIGGTKATLEGWATTANLRIPLTRGRVQPYLVAGFGVVGIEEAISGSNSSWEEHFGFRAGGGVDTWITEHIAVGLGLDYLHVVQGFDKGYLTLTANVAYRF